MTYRNEDEQLARIKNAIRVGDMGALEPDDLRVIAERGIDWFRDVRGDEDTIDAEVEQPPDPDAFPNLVSPVDALAIASEGVRKAEEAARAAQAAFVKAQEDARKAELAAETLRQAALAEKERAWEESRLAAAAAEKAAFEALRPAEVEWEIHITDVWEYSRATRAIEFVVPGAPNLQRHGENDPQLRAYVSVGAVRDDYDSGWGFSYGRGARALTSGAAPMKNAPRSPELDRRWVDGTLVVRQITDANIEEACRRSLKLHLDMVDLERQRLGQQAIERKHIGKITRVKA